jgi:hypothetical protein
MLDVLGAGFAAMVVYIPETGEKVGFCADIDAFWSQVSVTAFLDRHLPISGFGVQVS